MLTGTVWKDTVWKDVWKAVWEAPSVPVPSSGGVYFILPVSDETVYLKQLSGSVVAGVASVTATSPITSSGGANPDIGIPAATNLVPGYATAAHIIVLESVVSLAHASGSDNQDLSGKVDKVAGSSLVVDTEIAKIHANTLDHTQGTDTTLGTQAEALDMGSFKINNLADPALPHDAVNLEYLQNTVGVSLNYWLEASNVMQSLYVGTPAFVTNVSSAQGTEVELTSIYWLSSLAQTPAPFVIKNGVMFFVHGNAKVSAGHYKASYKTVKIRAKLYHTNSVGADLVQIGAVTSDGTTLTEANIRQELMGIVVSEVSVPASRRLLIKMFCYVDVSAAPNYPTIAVEYGDVHDHCSLPVTGAILGNFLPLAGGTMTGDIAMSGTRQVTGLAAPDANGEAIRATVKITEVALEAVIDAGGVTEETVIKWAIVFGG